MTKGPNSTLNALAQGTWAGGLKSITKSITKSICVVALALWGPVCGVPGTIQGWVWAKFGQVGIIQKWIWAEFSQVSTIRGRIWVKLDQVGTIRGWI